MNYYYKTVEQNEDYSGCDKKKDVIFLRQT